MVSKVKDLSVPIKKVEFSDTVNPSLKKCSIYVMHTGENFNGSSFSRESVDKAKESLKNIPILASIKRDENYDPIDFEGHEMETRIIENSDDFNIKVVYIETPIGIVPESNNYRIETLENGEEWVVVDGYIWKEYGNGAYELLASEDKKVSMEIAVNDGYFDSEYLYHIEDYHYLGITCLGESHPPAMGSNAIISMFSESNSMKNEYNKLLNEIQSLEEGGSEMTVDETIVEEVKATNVEETEVVDNPIDEEDGVEGVEEEFAEDSIEEIEVVEEDDEDFAKKKKKKGSGGTRKCSTEESDEDEKEDFEAKYNEALAELNELKAKYVDLEANFESLNGEVSELREFKLNIEKQEKDVELNSIFEEYSALNKIEEYSSLFEKRYELDKEEIIKSLKVIAFDNGINIKKAKKDFSKNTIKVPVVGSVDLSTNSAWDVLERHIKK